MYTVEVYSKKSGNVLKSRTGFRSIEHAMDWGESQCESGMNYRVFPS